MVRETKTFGRYLLKFPILCISHSRPVNIFSRIFAIIQVSFVQIFHSCVPTRVFVAADAFIDGVVGVASALLATRMHPSCSRGISEKSIPRPLPHAPMAGPRRFSRRKIRLQWFSHAKIRENSPSLTCSPITATLCNSGRICSFTWNFQPRNVHCNFSRIPLFLIFHRGSSRFLNCREK